MPGGIGDLVEISVGIHREQRFLPKGEVIEIGFPLRPAESKSRFHWRRSR